MFPKFKAWLLKKLLGETFTLRAICNARELVFTGSGTVRVLREPLPIAAVLRIETKALPPDSLPWMQVYDLRRYEEAGHSLTEYTIRFADTQKADT